MRAELGWNQATQDLPHYSTNIFIVSDHSSKVKLSSQPRRYTQGALRSAPHPRKEESGRRPPCQGTGSTGSTGRETGEPRIPEGRDRRTHLRSTLRKHQVHGYRTTLHHTKPDATSSSLSLRGTRHILLRY